MNNYTETVEVQRSPDVKRFIRKHTKKLKIVDHPVATNYQKGKGNTSKDKSRKADNVKMNYEAIRNRIVQNIVCNITDEAILTETFDMPYKWKWIRKDIDYYIARFTASNDSDIRVVIKLFENDYWDIRFTRNDSLNITGGKDAFRIFATVMEIIKAFVKIESPEKMNFIAEKMTLKERGNSRSSLYERMVKKHAMDLGYKFEIEDTSTETVFKLTKKDSSMSESSDMKLDDGSVVHISDSDQDFLDKLFDQLSSKNQNLMKKNMMTNKNNYNDILQFAKEVV